MDSAPKTIEKQVVLKDFIQISKGIQKEIRQRERERERAIYLLGFDLIVT